MHVPAVTRLGDDTNGVCNIGSGCCPHSRTGVNGTVSNNLVPFALAFIYTELKGEYNIARIVDSSKNRSRVVEAKNRLDEYNSALEKHTAKKGCTIDIRENV